MTDERFEKENIAAGADAASGEVRIDRAPMNFRHRAMFSGSQSGLRFTISFVNGIHSGVFPSYKRWIFSREEIGALKKTKSFLRT